MTDKELKIIKIELECLMVDEDCYVPIEGKPDIQLVIADLIEYLDASQTIEIYSYPAGEVLLGKTLTRSLLVARNIIFCNKGKFLVDYAVNSDELYFYRLK